MEKTKRKPKKKVTNKKRRIPKGININVNLNTNEKKQVRRRRRKNARVNKKKDELLNEIQLLKNAIYKTSSGTVTRIEPTTKKEEEKKDDKKDQIEEEIKKQLILAKAKEQRNGLSSITDGKSGSVSGDGVGLQSQPNQGGNLQAYSSQSGNLVTNPQMYSEDENIRVVQLDLKDETDEDFLKLLQLYSDQIGKIPDRTDIFYLSQNQIFSDDEEYIKKISIDKGFNAYIQIYGDDILNRIEKMKQNEAPQEGNILENRNERVGKMETLPDDYDIKKEDEYKYVNREMIDDDEVIILNSNNEDTGIRIPRVINGERVVYYKLNPKTISIYHGNDPNNTKLDYIKPNDENDGYPWRDRQGRRLDQRKKTTQKKTTQKKKNK